VPRRRRVTTFLLFLIFLGFLIWGIRSGQFMDIESPKYRILRGYERSDNLEDAKEK